MSVWGGGFGFFFVVVGHSVLCMYMYCTRDMGDKEAVINNIYSPPPPFPSPEIRSRKNSLDICIYMLCMYVCNFSIDFGCYYEGSHMMDKYSSTL